jgi:hypothetical protein
MSKRVKIETNMIVHLILIQIITLGNLLLSIQYFGHLTM